MMNMKDRISFTMRMDKDLVRKIDYMAEYYGRNRTGEIIWRMRCAVKGFEKENGKMELEGGVDRK